MLNVTDLKVKNLRAPLGISCRDITFSWILKSEESGVMQASYRIFVKKQSGDLLWDSGEKASAESVYVPYSGPALTGMEIYHWKVRITDNYGRIAEAESSFETAPDQPQLHAAWVETDLPEATEDKAPSVFSSFFPSKKASVPEELLRPATYFRRDFPVKGKPVKARLYASAHGFYIPFVNGQKAGDRLMAPEFTAYRQNILFQTYDITDMLTENSNTFGAIVADGWWIGRISASGVGCFFGKRHALWCQIDIWYEDGTCEEFCSDEQMTYGVGAYLYSDFFIGEKYDPSKEAAGWNRPGFSGHWPNVHKGAYTNDTLYPQENAPVRVVKTFAPSKILRTPKGETVLDTGQIIHGMLTMRVHAPKGTVITLQHSELLDNEGNYCHSITGQHKEHLDTYICTGDANEEYTPSFAFHGFRYVRITGYDLARVEDFTVNVVASDNEDIGSLSTSNPKLNRLLENIYWSQIGNFVSVPTDCPQRERGGYTGDLEVYIDTATMFQDNRNFIQKWLKDLRLEQREDGSVQDKIPLDSALQYQHDGMMNPTHGIAGWGDAAVIVPYKLYRRFGDRSVLETQYESMKRWTAHVTERAENYNPKKLERSREYRHNQKFREACRYLWNTGVHYGDWLVPSTTISADYLQMFLNIARTGEIFASGYYANTVRLMEKTAHILQKTEDERYYHDLYRKIRSAFALRYFKEDGSLTCDMQGAYVMALAFHLVPNRWKQQTINTLIEKIRQNHGCLDTGFLSIGLIMDALTENGKIDEAYKLLYQTQCPSWLYEVDHGATTMWELWNNIQEGKEPNKSSYNHYAFGCVGDWMFRMIGGLVPEEPGYRRFTIQPRPDPSLQYADCRYRCIYGDIAIHWEKAGNGLALQVEIPCNTSARLILPNGKEYSLGSGKYKITESGIFS